MNNGTNDKKPGKTFTIVVNGRPREVDDRELTYIEAIQLAYPGEVPTDLIVFTVTYTYRNDKDGTMVAGDTIKTKDRMILNVSKTDKS